MPEEEEQDENTETTKVVADVTGMEPPKGEDLLGDERLKLELAAIKRNQSGDT